MAASLRGLSPGAEERQCWKPLPCNAVKTVTENTSLCAIVICKAYSLVVLKCPINPITNSNPVCHRSVT
jgi:hypothetical protein